MPAVETVNEKPAIQTGVDYVIKPADKLGAGGAKARFRDNIEAIRVLKKLQAENAPYATLEEQQKLARYVGWGGLPQAFDGENIAWKNEYAELRRLLNPEEYNQARRSTQDAHYTAEDVITGIYAGLRQLGVSGAARVLEPSAGIGRYLYPHVSYKNKGFQDVLIPERHFDLAMGNPPFGSQRIHDRNRPDLDFYIHNYFLAKSVDSLREGGIGAFVVSRYFMYAHDSRAREYIASKANLLAAIRLPNTAFKTSALTEVTADIVFFQRTDTPEQNPQWVQTGELTIVPDEIRQRFGDLNLHDQRNWRLNIYSAAYGSLNYYGSGSRATVEAFTKVLLEKLGGQNEYDIFEEEYARYGETSFYDKLKLELHLESSDKTIRLNRYFLDNLGQMIGTMAVTNKMFHESAGLLPPSCMQKLEEEIKTRLALLPVNVYSERTLDDEAAAPVKSA